MTIKLKLSYYTIGVTTILVLIGFVWLGYQKTISMNNWYAELQDTKRISIIAERECVPQTLKEIKKFYR